MSDFSSFGTTQIEQDEQAYQRSCEDNYKQTWSYNSVKERVQETTGDINGTINMKYCGKEIKVEPTVNPQWYRLIVKTESSYFCKLFQAINRKSAAQFGLLKSLEIK